VRIEVWSGTFELVSMILVTLNLVRRNIFKQLSNLERLKLEGSLMGERCFALDLSITMIMCG
jgi:hypothetical protein